jgi:hypothetical protein
VKGPVRDVLRRTTIWDEVPLHSSAEDAVEAIRSGAASAEHRPAGIDETAETGGDDGTPAGPSVDGDQVAAGKKGLSHVQ